MMIATASGVSLDVPDEAWYSFYNSPYVGHRTGTAVDVYFEDLPLLPVEEGKVERIRKVRAPKGFGSGEDYVISIHIGDSLCLKVLHVRPGVVEGERLHLGDPLGDTIVSGFFRPWSSKHAHFEIRPCNDWLRARGGLHLVPTQVKRVPCSWDGEYVIVEVTREYAWMRPVRPRGKCMTPLATENFSVEGGIPHYRIAALFSEGKIPERVEIFGATYDRVERRESAGIFEISGRMEANGRSVVGVGVYCNNPLMKIIGTGFQEGEIVKLRLIKPRDSSVPLP